ncbi:hypothetical protein PDUR_21245 [Paenibacillus durus]|uniref:Transposase IS4-like domain-containing protein n=2 Tax=Paenibacillus durus TaxID=44251 RepID=A0A089HUV7_PAEDU|nr:hypothetical protein PDUR_21245 [Paenibacillus durus]
MIQFYEKDSLLERMFGGQKITQSVFSRFMVSSFAWQAFNLKRVAKLQEQEETMLKDDDVIALDDTLVEHNHARNMPFIYRLWDHCSKVYVNAMNMVVLHAVKANGFQYPLLYAIWKQDNGESEHLSKLHLALNLLQQVKDNLRGTAKCWVAMDSWYLAKDLYLGIEGLGFHWVSRAKSNMTLYRKVKVHGKERIVKTLPSRLIQEAKPTFSFWRKKGIRCMPFRDIYIAIDEIHKGKGYRKEPVLKAVNAVVTAYLEEDQETGSVKETFALLISDQIEAPPEKIVQVYRKRWSIEVFFRNAKQELGMNDCHSTDEHHIHAHMTYCLLLKRSSASLSGNMT